MKDQPKLKPASAGFTLIEMLVVIAIIALLAGLVFPAVGKTLYRAKETTKLSNLRQMHIATTLYATENGGKLLPAANGKGDWRARIGEYIDTNAVPMEAVKNKLFIDPCFKGYTGDPNVGGYAFNTQPGLPETVLKNVGQNGGKGPFDFFSITEPMSRILIGDSDVSKYFNGGTDPRGGLSATRHQNGTAGMFLMFGGNTMTLPLDEAVVAATDPANFVTD